MRAGGGGQTTWGAGSTVQPAGCGYRRGFTQTPGQRRRVFLETVVRFVAAGETGLRFARTARRSPVGCTSTLPTSIKDAGFLEKLRQISVFAVNRAKVHRKRQYARSWCQAGSTNTSRRAARISDVFRRQTVYPGFTWVSHTLAVIAHELQHEQLD